ncbi:desmoglein-3 [Gracilinanus agilis]|uniref:desmoglein-3 n=1 Tax=Gracilinanus agilis TaxID=191870 RepID=UPI001CFEA60D|nr:desmoglein-3 [Gracilinanus agilis]
MMQVFQEKSETMDWLALRTVGVLVILMVVVEVNCTFWVEVKGENEEDGTALQKPHRRYKREWVKFAKPCREGEDNSKRNPIATITSDYQKHQKIRYRISGKGVDQPPHNVFVVNPRTGEINITQIVDREETPMFLITCQALDEWGRDVEKHLVLTVKILDINDNRPIFSQSTFFGEIEENSAANTLVMFINATDADEPNHLNSKIAFKIISQEPAGQPMFLLNRLTGEVRSMTSTLDREKNSKYSLLVSAADLDGAGQATECGCQITIKDVNDNFPIFRESQYSIEIKENTLSSEVIRFQVTDLDEEFTDNWYADYFFTSGNEGKWFVIETDKKTNEGVMKMVKTLDFEQFQTMELGIAVRNKAPFHQSIISQYRIHSTPVRVQIINVKEGIAFHPTSKTFEVQKGISYKKLINYVVGTYQAIDEDTGKTASFVRYELGRNDGGFLAIDSKTAQIKFIRNLNRDSTFIVNKTITAEILAIDDNTGKTSTGTIIVRVPNFDENCPQVITDRVTVCRTSGSVIVTAKPLQNHPDTGPFTFSLVEQPMRTPVMWSVTTINATSAKLETQQTLSSGTQSLSLLVTDRQGMSCEIPETLELRTCDCDENQRCVSVLPFPDGNRQKGRSSVSLGPAAIGLLFLGLLMLLCEYYIPLFYSSSNMKSQFGKAFACADEDDGQGISDCLLIYDDEGIEEAPSSPVGSVGCCSFIADDFDDNFLDSLGPKFKKLADISMGIDDEPKLSQAPEKTNITAAGIPGSQSAPASSTYGTCQPTANVTCPPTTFYSNEIPTLSASGPVFQPAIPIPDPLLQGNFLVTESYTASGSFTQPSTVVFDPRLTENVTVTERVICPISGVSGIQGNLHGPTQLGGSCNVACTEDPCSRLI